MNPQMTTVELLRQRQSLPVQTTATSFARGAAIETKKRPFHDVSSTHLQTLQNGVYPTKRRNSGPGDGYRVRESEGSGVLGDYLAVSKIHQSPNRSHSLYGNTSIIPEKGIQVPFLPETENDLVYILCLYIS